MSGRPGRHAARPHYRLGIKAFVGSTDPADEDARQELALRVGRSSVRPMVVGDQQLGRALDRYCGPAESAVTDGDAVPVAVAPIAAASAGGAMSAGASSPDPG